MDEVTELVAPSPSAQNERPRMLSDRSTSVSMSSSVPRPASNRSYTPTYQYVPSRHGVHLPHDSCLKNSDHFNTACTTQSSSSKIWTADVPFIEPALTTESKSSGRSR